jgi:hypothetical protein
MSSLHGDPAGGRRVGDRDADARAARADGAPADVETGVEESGLAARVRLLEFENERLRAERVRAAQRRHRRGALWFLAVGLLAVGGGVVLPDSRTLLFSLGAVGLFSAGLTYYLTGSGLVSVDTVERVYLAHAETLAEMIDELGLQDVAVYVPTGDGDDRGGEGLSRVRLFVPQSPAYAVPADLDSVFVVGAEGAERGVAVHPVGSALFAAVAASLREPLAGTPPDLADQLSAALVEDLELAREATPEYDAANDRVTVRVRDGVLGPLDRFDHPVASFLGTGFARGLGRPVRTEVVRRDGTTSVVVCSWGDVGRDDRETPRSADGTGEPSGTATGADRESR